MMYRGIQRTAGLFLAAVMLFASLPAYAAEENEAEAVSAEAAEPLPQEGEVLPAETEDPEAPPEAEGTPETEDPEAGAAPESSPEPIARDASEVTPFTGTSGT